MSNLSIAFLSYLAAAQKLQKARENCDLDYYFCFNDEEELKIAESEYIKELKSALGLNEPVEGEGFHPEDDFDYIPRDDAEEE